MLMCLQGSSWSPATADAQLQALLSGGFLTQLGASLVTQTVKNLPSIQETQVQFLGQEDPLEKGMATHSSILTWEIPWTEEPGGYSPGGLKESDTTNTFNFHCFTQILTSVPFCPFHVKHQDLSVFL